MAALVVAILIKTFVVQPFFIPSESMVHTLEVHDRVMVSKLSYRFGDVERGDIVVFETGPDLDLSPPEAVVQAILDALGIRDPTNEDLIKRVIGLPGDTVEIKANSVVINGQPLTEPYLNDGTAMADMPLRTIPEGQLWVMGDNRNESSDSRVFGPIEVEDVVGQAILRIWPLDRIGGLGDGTG
ncbi:MAG: signal peptidase I [Acidimicrobiia bacterium]|nr:signal peptidase I [Acidimicrobiia bacterium]